jgi:ubiquinone/menaquinone biosynthesis C-methylase UbiE
MKTSFHDHFSEVAGRYAEFRPRYPAALFECLAGLVSSSGGGLVWDCACGNGQATMDLAAHFAQVIGTDASAEQIASAPRHPKIQFRVAPAEQSGLPEHAVDLVTVAQAIHWFDLERFYAEVRRVLKPTGVLAIWAYGIMEVEGATVNQLSYDYYAETVGPYWPPERRLVEEGYRTIPFPFAELAAPAVRMEAEWNLDQLLGYFGTWSATNRCWKATGINPVEILRPKLESAWGESAVRRKITWPLALRIGRAAGHR